MSTEGTRLRQEAAACEREARESFERCDTDGFLSQWASGITARLKRTQAEIADAGGTAVFARWILTNVETGAVMDTREVRTRFGMRWRIDSTDEWISTSATARTLARKGYEKGEVIERAEAAACIAGEGTGLSGAANAYVRVYRAGTERSEGWRCVGIADADEYIAAREAGEL